MGLIQPLPLLLFLLLFLLPLHIPGPPLPLPTATAANPPLLLLVEVNAAKEAVTEFKNKDTRPDPLSEPKFLILPESV